jgi:hemoglobin/transferrin/lactoferrin receptor protein
MSLTWKPQALPVRLSVSGSAAAMQDRLSSNDIRDTQRIPPGGTPSYYFFNFGAGWQPFKDVEVSLRVSNLLNRDYRIHGSGLNEAGRSLMLAVNLKY